MSDGSDVLLRSRSRLNPVDVRFLTIPVTGGDSSASRYSDSPPILFPPKGSVQSCRSFDLPGIMKISPQSLHRARLPARSVDTSNRCPH